MSPTRSKEDPPGSPGLKNSTAHGISAGIDRAPARLCATGPEQTPLVHRGADRARPGAARRRPPRSPRAATRRAGARGPPRPGDGLPGETMDLTILIGGSARGRRRGIRPRLPRPGARRAEQPPERGAPRPERARTGPARGRDLAPQRGAGGPRGGAAAQAAGRARDPGDPQHPARRRARLPREGGRVQPPGRARSRRRSATSSASRTSCASASRRSRLRNGQLDKLIGEQTAQLERIAGMSSDEARARLMANVENEAKAEAARRVAEIRETAQRNAEREARKIIGARHPALRRRPRLRGDRLGRAPAQRRHEGAHHRPRGPQHPRLRGHHRRGRHHRRHARGGHPLRLRPGAPRDRPRSPSSAWSPTAASTRPASRRWWPR